MSSPLILPATPAQRLVCIIDSLCAAIARRGVGGVLTAPLLFLLWARLRRAAARVTVAAARIAAGIPHRVARPRAPRPSRPQPLRLPRGHAWLVRLVPGAAAYGTQLQTLLADPLIAPLIAVPSVRRMLNPLCRMLGVPVLPPLRPAPAPPAGDGPTADAPPAQSGRTRSPPIRAFPPASPAAA